MRGLRKIPIGNRGAPPFAHSHQENPWASYKPLNVPDKAAASDTDGVQQVQSSPHITAEGKRQASSIFYFCY